MEELCGLILLLMVFLAAKYGSVQVVSAQAQKKEQPVVVVDVGHGGRDPGKVGIDGSLEKDVNLAIGSEVKNISGAVGCKGGHDPGNGHGSLWERGLQKKDGGYEGAVPDHRVKRRGSGGQHPPEQLSPGGGFRRPGLLL